MQGSCDVSLGSQTLYLSTQLDLILIRLDLIQSWLDLIQSWLDLAKFWMRSSIHIMKTYVLLIHNSASLRLSFYRVYYHLFVGLVQLEGSEQGFPSHAGLLLPTQQKAGPQEPKEAHRTSFQGTKFSLFVCSFL